MAVVALCSVAQKAKRLWTCTRICKFILDAFEKLEQDISNECFNVRQRVGECRLQVAKVTCQILAGPCAPCRDLVVKVGGPSPTLWNLQISCKAHLSQDPSKFISAISNPTSDFTCMVALPTKHVYYSHYAERAQASKRNS